MSYGWGIVGTGQMASVMAGEIAASGAGGVVAVASRDVARGGAFADAHRIARAYAGVAALLADGAVDIVYIATPPDQHCVQACAALEAGKHVLCEKPLATTVAEARAIEAAAARSGRFCMEALWTHFLPAVVELERRLGAGAIGTPRHLQASFGIPTDPADPVFRFGNGALRDRGVYPISLALRLLGAVAEVEAVVARGPAGGDTEATLLLTHAGGATSAIACSLTAYLGNDLTLGGTGGRAALAEPITRPDLLGEAHAMARRGGAAGPAWRQSLARAVPQIAVLRRLRGTTALRYRATGYAHQIAEVHRAIAAGETQSPSHPLSRAVAVLEVIEAVDKAGALPLDPAGA